jgi:putative transposase
MPRKPRHVDPDRSVHVIWRGVRRSRIFVDDLDATRFVEMLTRVCEGQGWMCHAYCLMPNHVHLLLRTPDGDLPTGMQRLGTRYAMLFNRRHGFAGHVFERRYWSAAVERDSHLFQLIHYIAHNPVRAGLCEAPEDWRWSSFSEAAATLRSFDVGGGVGRARAAGAVRGGA